MPPCVMQLHAWAVLSITWNFSPSQKSFSASGPAGKESVDSTTFTPHALYSRVVGGGGGDDVEDGGDLSSILLGLTASRRPLGLAGVRVERNENDPARVLQIARIMGLDWGNGPGNGR